MKKNALIYVPPVPEPSIEELNVSDDAPDGLAFLIQHTLDTRPDFRDVWDAIQLVGRLEDERRRLGLSQAEVARRMGVGRTAVAKLENDPTGVAFARVMAYARALGVELVPKPSKAKPEAPARGPGRRVARSRAA